MASGDNSSDETRDSSKVEKGQTGGANEQDGAPPTPVHFFHPALKQVRREVYFLWARTSALCPIRLTRKEDWAVEYRVYHNYNALGVYVVDFDGQPPYDTSGPPLLGPMVTQALQAQNMLAEPPDNLKLNSPPPHPGWEVLPPSMFNNDPMQVRQSVYNFDAWAAIIVNPNATAMLRQAVATGNTTYDPLGAGQIFYVEARDQTTIDTYILPVLYQFRLNIASMFGEMWGRTVFQNASTDPTILTNIQNAPQAISPAIGWSVFNLRPFDPPVATPAVTVGLIYLIIFSFFSFGFYLPIHLKFIKPEGHPPLIYWQKIVWRWCATVAAYFFLSFSYSLVSLAFQIPFNNQPAPATEVADNSNGFGAASFVVYWMVNYVGMIALGMACENVAMIIGQPWAGLWLIFWVITNVSTSFYEISLAPRFYYWGYAWPLHNNLVVEASRQILFNLHSRIGLNFGVLLAWCAINTVCFVPSCYFFRWQMLRQKKKEAESKE
ncbi:MAG: hypothetical protein Q9191_000467 [Dirinaria sp. TL-2023a]